VIFFNLKKKKLHDLKKKSQTEMYQMITMPVVFPQFSVFIVIYLHGDFRPDLFSWDRVVKMSPIERLEHAFSKAQTYLGIEKLLDPEGMVQY
jgi:hypothetical protein